MIISLRGTNGSGKSTIVRDVMNRCESVKALMLPFRKKPAGYFLRLGEKPIFIPGHYEIANGGVDTLDSLDTAYNMMLAVHELACDIIYEGKNMSDGIKRVMLMHEAKIDIRIIYLTTPLDVCVKSVRERGHNIKESTITAIYNKCEHQYVALKEFGVNTVKASREDALRYIFNWLEIG